MVLTVLSELRYTIHGSANVPIHVEAEARRPELFMLIPSSRRNKVLEGIDSQGGHLRLWKCTLQLLNQLMECTRVERLLTADQIAQLLAQSDTRENPFGRYQSQRVRWQLGF
jgi:hypothetical protein